MQHNVDIMRLAAVNTPQLLQESDYVRGLRSNKYNMRICGYAFELMLTFLQDHKCVLSSLDVCAHSSKGTCFCSALSTNTSTSRVRQYHHGPP